MVGAAMREARTTASSVWTLYTINSTLFNSSFVELLILEKAVCSKGTFILEPPKVIVPRTSPNFPSFGTGWMVQGHGTDPNEMSISCSVIYQGQETGYGIRFSFEKSGGMTCWAVWRPDGNDINYPLGTSWRWYKVGAENNMDVFVYDLQFGNPVKQGVICPGN